MAQFLIRSVKHFAIAQSLGMSARKPEPSNWCQQHMDKLAQERGLRETLCLSVHHNKFFPQSISNICQQEFTTAG